MEDFIRHWKRAKSKLKSESKIKECFHFDSDSCKGKIKRAHSLQQNGVLSILEYEINKNKVIYSFLHPKMNGYLIFNGFEPLGKKEASTFHGFCDFHDSTIFSCIENNPVNIDSNEHCFMLCYRAFAKEYHAKIEFNKGVDKNETFNKPENKLMKNDMLSGAALAIRDMGNIKTKLNYLLENKIYDGLEYFTYTIDKTIPIACSTSITPTFSYKGTSLNNSINVNDIYQNIMLTVLPTKGETHVLFGYFPEDRKSLQYIDELEELSDKQLEKAITSILIGEVENTFISPLIWKIMTKKEKDILMQEISFTNPLFPFQPESFLRVI